MFTTMAVKSLNHQVQITQLTNNHIIVLNHSSSLNLPAQITPPQLSVITLKVIINLIEIVVVVVVGLYLINHIMQDINVPVSNSKISQHSAKQNTVSSFATVSKVFVNNWARK